MKLICITGIDGAGKTTLAKKVILELQEEGVQASYVYGRTFPILSRFLMALGGAVFLRNEDIWRDYEGYESSKKGIISCPVLRWIYTAAILIDFYPQIWLKLVPHIIGKRTVVVDRYIYDTVINDLSAHLGYSADQTIRAIEKGLRLLPKPDLLILIDLTEEVAFERKDDIPHIGYLTTRRRLYTLLKGKPEVSLLDGQEDADLIFAQTMQLINSQSGFPLENEAP